MFLTHVRPWKGTFHGKGTVGPGLSRSHPPSSAEPAASPETNGDKRKFESATYKHYMLFLD